jgi:hypothetical protein
MSQSLFVSEHRIPSGFEQGVENEIIVSRCTGRKPPLEQEEGVKPWWSKKEWSQKDWHAFDKQ